MRTRTTSTLGILAGIAMLGFLLSACAGQETSTPQHRPSATATSPGRYPVVEGKVAIYFDPMPQHAVANSGPLTAHIVLVNGLGRSFTVPAACNGWLQAGLKNQNVPFEAIYTLIGCDGLVIKPGITRVTRKLLTTYGSCSGTPAGASATQPRCGGPRHDRMPALPAGEYEVALDTTPIPHAFIVNPVKITVVSTVRP